MARDTGPDGRDAEISTLKAELEKSRSELRKMTDQWQASENRVLRYQIAHIRLLNLVGDLCSADGYVAEEAKRLNRLHRSV